MQLSPEERKKIYEEEKTRIEGQEKKNTPESNVRQSSSTNAAEATKAGAERVEDREESRDNQWERTRPGRIAASAFSIAWSLALLIFFNFFNQNIAYYHRQGTGRGSIWIREPVLTSDFSSWLPVLNVSLVLTMLGHALLIAIDKYVLRELTLLVLDLIAIIVIVALLAIFPFDFSVFPYAMLQDGLDLGLRIILGLVIFGIGIGVIVRFIKLTVHLIRRALNS